MLDFPKSHKCGKPQGRKANKGFCINRLISLLKDRTKEPCICWRVGYTNTIESFCAARFLAVLDILKCLAISPTRGIAPHLATEGRTSIISAIFM